MKKAIILVVSCNQERYLNEEQIIRGTWGKDVLDGKYENIELVFVRSTNETEYMEDNILFLKAPDDINGTYEKLRRAIMWFNDKEVDYFIKTNTNTYINMNAIEQFLAFDNVDCEKIYGPQLIMNNIPFLRGNFLIIPKKISNILIGFTSKYVDDVTISFVLMKKYGTDKVLLHFSEIDCINNIKEKYFHKLPYVFCVRIKDELNYENNIINMIGLHNMYKSIKEFNISYPHNFTSIETIYGIIPLNVK